MWSDNDIDNAFQRLNPPDPEPTPFPLDAWLRLETQLDEAVIARAVRRRVWRFFAAEVAVVALAVLGWLLWPTSKTVAPEKAIAATEAANGTGAIASGTTGAAKTPSGATLAQPIVTSTSATPLISTEAASTLASVPNTQASAGTDSDNQALLAKTHRLTSPNPASANVAAASAHSPSRLLITALPAESHKQTRNSRETTASRAISGGAVANTGISPAARKAFSSERKAAYATRKATTATETAAATTASIDVPVAARLHAAGHKAHNPASSYASQVAAQSRRQGTHARKLHRAGEVAVKNQAVLNSSGLSSSSESAITSAMPNNIIAEQAAQATAATPTDLAALTTHDVALAMAASPALPTPLATVAVVPAEEIQPVRQPRLFVGLVGAPDVTTVKFADVQRPMLNFGVVLEYRISQRLRVSTGLLRANKEYYAHREDYTWTNPLVYTRNFSWVDGACTVLDVPLNLRYDAVVRPQYRLFGTAGLSSFFMQRERYKYDYVDNNMPYTWERDFTNENQHLFSILNLSAGIERSLSTRWSLQAEPYLKLPLAGVGAGKVKLTSAGVFLGVKYGF